MLDHKALLFLSQCFMQSLCTTVILFYTYFSTFCLSGITVLLSLTVFMLLVAEIMPATSDSVPLIGKCELLNLNIILNLTQNFLAVDDVLDSTACMFTSLFLLFSLAQYFASTMMIVGLSVVVTVLILQFHHHDPHGGKMPRWVSENSWFHLASSSWFHFKVKK